MTEAFLSDAMNLHGDAVYRLGLYRLKNRADAENVFQDTFLAFYREQNAPSWDTAHIRAWLLRVAINKCNDIARRKSVCQRWLWIIFRKSPGPTHV